MSPLATSSRFPAACSLIPRDPAVRSPSRRRRGGTGSGRGAGRPGPARTRRTRGGPRSRPSARAAAPPRPEASVDLGEPRVELCAIGDGLALRRGPRAQLRVARAAREVLVRRRGVEALDRPAHPDLAVELAPVEDERGVARRVELRCLRRFVVGEEAKADGAEALQEDHPGVRPPVGVDGRKGHRVPERHLLRVGPPGRELRDRIAQKIVPVEARHVGTARAHGANATRLQCSPRTYPGRLAQSVRARL